MIRPRLSLARRAERKAIRLSLVKKALRLFAGRGVSREVRHANARKWLSAMQQLGDRHVLHREKPPVTWGQPGKPVTRGVHAPRRFGER